MDTLVLQDPLFLVVLGFGLAMAIVVVLLVLTSASRNPRYAPPPVAYSGQDPGDRLRAGCIFFPLLIFGVVALLALLS